MKDKKPEKTQEQKDKALGGGFLGSLFSNPNRKKAVKLNKPKPKPYRRK